MQVTGEKWCAHLRQASKLQDWAIRVRHVFETRKNYIETELNLYILPV